MICHNMRKQSKGGLYEKNYIISGDFNIEDYSMYHKQSSTAICNDWSMVVGNSYIWNYIWLIPSAMEPGSSVRDYWNSDIWIIVCECDSGICY